jgi:3-oxoacyl-[acyl-carrier protein] reductase
LSKVLAMELGPHGIRVNVVSPGYIDVRGWSDAFPDRASEELRAGLVRSIPIGRAGRPVDIAQAVLFLCSEAASHISGAVLDVDGGSLAGRFSLPSNAGSTRA